MMRQLYGSLVKKYFIGLLIVSLCVFAAQTAQAVSLWWDGTSASWNTAANWSTVSGATTPDPLAVPGASDDAIFNITTVNGAETVTLDADQSANSLTFNNTGTTALTGGGTSRTLTLGAGGITVNTGAGAVTIGSATAGQEVNVDLGANQTWNNVTALTVNNVISGTGFGISKTGTGTLTLNGANTYTGGTTITGILLAGNNSALSTGSVTVNNASGNQLRLGSGVNVANALTINGGGATGQGALYVPTGNATYSGTIDITAAASAGSHFATGSHTRLLTIAGDNTITSTVPVTVGNGYVLYSGAQSYTTGTTLGISSATIQFAKLTSMPATGTVAMSTGTTLAVNVGGTGEFAISGTGAGTINGLLAGTGGQGAPVTLAAGSQIGIDMTNAPGGALTFSDPFVSTNNVGLVKLGPGTLTLSNTGSYGGAGAAGQALVVRQGTLLLTTTGTGTVTGEATVGGTFTTANGAAGYDATMQMDAGRLNVSSWLNVGRGNGIGGVSSNLILNNGATIAAGNVSAGYNGGNAANLPKGNITLNNGSSLIITGNGALNFAENTGSNFTMTLNSATLTGTGTGTKHIGQAGTGTLNINGTSSVILSGGTNTTRTNVGNGAGVGTLNLNGGSVKVGSLSIGNGANNTQTAVGTVNINSGTTLSTEGDVLLGFAGNASSQATLNLSGGTLNIATTTKRWMIIGQWDFTNSTVNVNSGNLNLNTNTDIRFKTQGGSGTNVFNLNGGNVTSYSDNATTANGAGVVDLMQSGSAAATSNTFNLNGGTLAVRQVLSNSNNGTRTFNFNGGTLKATGSTASLINLGTGTAVINVRDGGAIIDSNGFDITAATPLTHSIVGGDNAIDGGLTKSGAGTLTLTAFNTYTGPTTVNAGKLLLSGTGDINASSGISINGATARLAQNSYTPISIPVTVTNGTLDGTGTVNTVTVGNGTGGIIANGDGGTGALTIGSLTFNGVGAMNLNTSSTYPVLYTTTLNTSASINSITVNASNSNTIWAPGEYDLINYTTLGGAGFSAFQMGTIAGFNPARQTANLTNPAGYIALTITGENPVWTGLVNGNWTTASIPLPRNWNLPTLGPTNFIAGDTVVFDDTASGTTNVVVVDASVAPTSVLFNNNYLSYGISGNPISGTGYVSMTGNGTTTLSNNNTYTGGTTAGGAGTLVFTGNNNFGTGGVTVSGGTLTLSGNNTYSGATTVNSGTLNINNANAIGSGALTITGGAIDNTSGAPITLATANAQNWNGDFAFTGTNNLNLGAGAVTLSGSRTVTVNGVTLTTLTVGAPISGTTVGLAKAGPGTLMLTGTNTYSGTTSINNGTLEIGGGTTGLLTTDIQISPNSGDSGILYVSGGTVNANRVIIGGNSGNNGTPSNGTVTQTSGTINSQQWFTVGSGAGTTTLTGTYNLSGGTLNVISQLMEVANFNGTTGVVNMSGGAINLQTNVSIALGSNNSASNGTFTQSGGTVTFYSDAGTTVGGTGSLLLGRAGTLTSGVIYTYNLDGGTLTVPQISRNAAATNLSAAAFYFNGGTLRAARANATWMQGLSYALIKDGGAIIDDGGYAVTINQQLANDWSSTTGGLTKLGTGTLTLTGTNTYTGATAVNAGTLRLGVASEINGTSGITINGAGARLVQASSTAVTPTVTVTNGTLDGTGTVNTVTVGNGTGGIIANGDGGTGALTIGSLTFNGAGTINLNTSSTSPVLNTTSLITSGGGGVSTGLITVNAANASWDNGGVYNLIGYGTLSGVGFADFVQGTITNLSPRQTTTLSNPAGFIALSIVGDRPVWTGAVSNQWTTATIAEPKNWRLQNVPLTTTDFLTGDLALFDDTATGSTTVDISDANVSPISTVFNNTINNYTITSSGGFGISGGFLAKSGNGTLTLTTSNTYAGGTIVNGGTLNIDNASAIGTGALTIAGGTTINNTFGADIALTTNNAQNWNGNFTFTGTNSLNMGTGAVTLGGTAGQRTVTVAAGTLAVGSIPVATPGYGLTKAGAGTLALGSATSRIDGDLNVTGGTLRIGASDFYATGLTGSGTIEDGSATTRWLYINNAADNTFSGVLQDGAGGGRLGLNKRGPGRLTLTGNNNYTDATNVLEGTLVFNGTNNSPTYEGIGTAAAANGVLILTSGSTISVTSGTNVYDSSMACGTNVTGAGDIRVVTGSTLTTSRQLAVGNGVGAYGGYTQTGGTVTVGGFLTLGLGGSTSAINQSGGTFTMTGAPVTNAAGAGGIGVHNLSGTATFVNNSTVGYLTWPYVYWVGESGTGILNVSDSASMTLTNLGIMFARNAGSTGVVNLSGSATITTPSVVLGAGTSGIFNFNGGTLRANASSTAFMTGLTSAYVYGGGATIDDGGNAITIGQSLLAPTTGNGVSATGVTVGGGGYIDTPVVQVIGDGVGATAVATINSNGDLTGITIANPGVGYTYAGFSLVGGGIGNTGYTTGTPTIVPNTSGGLTKLGSGTLTLSGSNTYTGSTTINNGTLLATIISALPGYGTAGKVQVATGATVAVRVGGVDEFAAPDVLALDSNATFNTGSFIGFDTTNATGSFTYSNAIGGSKGLKKLGANTLILDATNTYTGATIVNAGTLELSSLGQIATASAISTAATTATFQVNGGTHTVGNISGIGATNVAAGSLTATSVVQGTLTIGAGATLTIAPIPGGPLAGAGSLSAVPEPSTWAMLMLAAMGLGMYYRRNR